MASQSLFKLSPLRVLGWLAAGCLAVVAVASFVTIFSFMMVVGPGLTKAASARNNSAALGATSMTEARPIPPVMLALYVKSATLCPGLPWQVLAGIGRVETDHGLADGTSPAGAQGPMQFMPSTFAAYALDAGDGDVPNIWDPADAVLSAAAYLCANGAGSPASLDQAIWQYNHSESYVASVLNYASEYARQYPASIINSQAVVPGDANLP